MVFLVLLMAAAGTEAVRKPPPQVRPAPPKYQILWKTGAAAPLAQIDPAEEGRKLAGDGSARLLVQWRKKPAPSLLERTGITLLRYIPRGTWIAKVSAETDWGALAPYLRYVGALPAEVKIDPALTMGTLGKGAGTLSARVRFQEDVDLEEGAAIVEAVGGRALLGLTVYHGCEVILPAGVLGELAGRDEVLWIGAPLPPPVPANDGIRANGNVDSAQTAPYSLSGADVKVGVWDGGPADTHTDYADRLHIIDGASPLSSHATHVMGTLAGSGAMSESQGGTALQWRGVAPACSLYSYDFYGDVPTEFGSAISLYDIDLTSNSWVLDVDEYAYHNCYLYGDYDGYAPEFDEVVTGYFGKRIPIIVAAGNERNDGDCSIDSRSGYACIPPPGTAKNVITVGAIHTNNSSMTDFSGYGPLDDGRIKPEIVAGGCQTTFDYSVRSTWPGNTYGANYYCGTSMATPAVSGAVALLMEAYRSGDGGPYPEEAHVEFKTAAGGAMPLPSTWKAVLIGSADDLGNPGPDYRFGFGRLNMMAALRLFCNTTVVEDSVADGALKEWAFSVPAGLATLKVSLAWDDPAGLPLADPALVNDLDLVLIPPAGPPEYPDLLDPSNPAAAATEGADHTNNVEQVVVSTPAAGTWTARVTGTNVPVGAAQTFSLVGFDTAAPAAPDSFFSYAPEESSLTLSWEIAELMEAPRLLLVRSGAAITWAPSDGTIYAPGDIVDTGVEVVDTAWAPEVIDEGLDPGTTYYYRAFAYDSWFNYSDPMEAEGTTAGGLTAVPFSSAVPERLHLYPARPNPFNPTTTIRFDLPHTGVVRLEIYDLGGRRVRLLLSETMSAGQYEETWDSTNDAGEAVSSGVYFARLQALEKVQTTKLTLIR